MTRIKNKIVQKDKNIKNDETKEVFVTIDVEECNKRLKLGWQLLHGSVAHVGGSGYNAKPHFILGKK